MIKFDPARPHGTTFGDAVVAHVQDGIEYGFDGLPVEDTARSPPQNMPSLEETAQYSARSEKMKAAWARRKAKAAQHGLET